MMVPPERAGYPAPPALAERRAAIAAAVAAGAWRIDPAPDSLEIANVRCLRFSPPARPHGTVLHIHGGAFRLGCPETLAPFAAALAAKCGVTVICPAYRLAPEHPFPAALSDNFRVMMALGTEGLIVAGDSAGGALAAGLAALVPQGGPPLAGLALLSPWLDLTVGAASFDTNAGSDPLFSPTAASEAAAAYLQGLSPLDPLASPTFAHLAGFPPTFINAGTGEVLADDARTFHQRLTAAGIASQLELVERMDHVAVTRDLALPGAAQTMAALAAFIDDGLAAARHGAVC
jgi:acetyl esterase/lipase